MNNDKVKITPPRPLPWYHPKAIRFRDLGSGVLVVLIVAGAWAYSRWGTEERPRPAGPYFTRAQAYMSCDNALCSHWEGTVCQLRCRGGIAATCSALSDFSPCIAL